MARCKSCSAPLLANTNCCQYCNVRNDVDLHAKHDFSITSRVSDRQCPHCDILLQTIQLQLDEPLYIERCYTCFGLFFDSGELEHLLEHSVSNVSGINLAHLENINIDRYPSKVVVKYIKCPVCENFMSRTNFAAKSGVVVDRCRAHGFWLDSGEVTHLLEWKKAGGQLLQEQVKQSKKIKKYRARNAGREDSWREISFDNDAKKETGWVDLLSYILNIKL